jgi:ceramide glucosyltransferase
MRLLYILGGIAIIQGLVSLLDGIRAARYMRTFRPRRTTNERVQVFCPCKGIDPEFEKNIRSILDQDHADFSVQFVVESENDPAYAALRQIGIADILVAGRASNCGQKVHNLACAVRQARTNAGILVFCDSDARFGRQWLSKLVAPLDQHTISTGYRWYVTSRFHLPTLLRSAWNASVVSMLGAHNRNFAWGGSTAIRRSAFDSIGVLDAWRGSVSDDYSITRAAERSGSRIIFVPECLVPSHGECTWRELLEFTTRQIIITRVYHPRIWRIGFIAQAVSSAAFLALPFAAPLLWLTIYGLSAAKACLRLRAVRSVLDPVDLSRFGWFYILFSPAIALLYLYNMIRSAAGTDIVWRQIHYRLVSPNETRVIGDSAGGS